METTTIVRIEMTFIEKNDAPFPLGAQNGNDLAHIIKQKLGADDAVVKDVKRFELEEGK